MCSRTLSNMSSSGVCALCFMRINRARRPVDDSRSFGLASAFAKSPFVLGAGSIRDAYAADRFIAAGARFIVGPSFNADVARLCNARRIPYLPGCATATEIVTAEESGVELVKVFPGDSLGSAFVRAIRGPLPETQVVVTGGVAATEASVNEWIGAGAACLGFGSALVSRAHTAHDGVADPADLTPAVARLISLVAAARAGASSGVLVKESRS